MSKIRLVPHGGVTTSEFFTEEEIAFMKAVDQCKREKKRPYPTWREVLAVAHSLGYRKVAEATELPTPVKGGVD